jgi:hypothetical protein
VLENADAGRCQPSFPAWSASTVLPMYTPPVRVLRITCMPLVATG